MSMITIQKFEKKIFKVFPNTEIVTLDEFKKYPKFCSVDENGEMSPDPEYDFTKLARIYKINDFEPDDFEDYDYGFILTFSENNLVVGARFMGYGTEKYRKKLDKFF